MTRLILIAAVFAFITATIFVGIGDAYQETIQAVRAAQ
jgi:hypothetical protein